VMSLRFITPAVVMQVLEMLQRMQAITVWQ
jgi:hypothetical protein